MWLCHTAKIILAYSVTILHGFLKLPLKHLQVPRTGYEMGWPTGLNNFFEPMPISWFNPRQQLPHSYSIIVFCWSGEENQKDKVRKLVVWGKYSSKQQQ